MQDRNQLGIRAKFKTAENLAAYKAMFDRMLTVVEKGYWKPTPEALAQMRHAQNDLAPAVAAENAIIRRRAELQPAPAPAPDGASVAAAKPPPIVLKGRVLEATPRSLARSAVATIGSRKIFRFGFAAVALIAVGWWWAGIRSG